MFFKIETYGCQMNVVDSEIITSILEKAGLKHTDDIDIADIIIFNTCSVRQHAEDRVIGRISNEISRKLKNPQILIGVVGCMAQRLGEALKKINKHIDFVVGVDQYTKLPEIINNCLQKHAFISDIDFATEQLYSYIEPSRSNDISAFISISRGCDNYCTYCIVPYTRGRERSRPIAEILSEVKNAVHNHIYEVTFLGQNVNSYSFDNHDFADLLKQANEIENIKRIRFITSHPKDLSDKLIETIATCEHVCPHVHLPLQSGNDEILQKMDRNYTATHYLSLISKLRTAIPEIAITTDVIAGFPSETDAQFQDTLNIMKDIRFDFAYMFKYSPRTGTQALNIPDDIPEETKLQRLQDLIDQQTNITTEKYKQKIGQIQEIYVESFSKKSPDELCGKTKDFKITVFPALENMIRSFVSVKIIDAVGWTLKGVPLDIHHVE